MEQIHSLHNAEKKRDSVSVLAEVFPSEFFDSLKDLSLLSFHCTIDIPSSGIFEPIKIEHTFSPVDTETLQQDIKHLIEKTLEEKNIPLHTSVGKFNVEYHGIKQDGEEWGGGTRSWDKRFEK